jgi:hypothetical protein
LAAHSIQDDANLWEQACHFFGHKPPDDDTVSIVGTSYA